MKMRFWQKTYLLTLAVFLICLNLGILSLSFYTYNKNVTATEESVKSEQYYIAKCFELDYETLSESGEQNSDPSFLMITYGTHYEDKEIFIAFKQNQNEIYSNFTDSYKINSDSIAHKTLNGKRHILISSSVCEGRFQFIFAKDVSSLDEEFRSLMLVYLITSLSVSLILATALYFILKKLSSPLERLKKITEAISEGDYTVCAEVKGNDEFAELAQSFNLMIEKINEQMKALELDTTKKQMLIDNLAHELRTPLTSIRGYAEYLEKAAASEERRMSAAKYIFSEAERLQRISEILLDSAYIRENAPPMEITDISIIAHDVADKLSLKANETEIELSCETVSLSVMGNATLLSMLLYNLTENAIRACDKGGRVRIYCEGTAVIVEDNGKGMSEEQLLHITEPFYRTDSSRSRSEGGVGLGLSLCKQIAKIHGISLKFESEIKKGTKISLDFSSFYKLTTT